MTGRMYRSCPVSSKMMTATDTVCVTPPQNAAAPERMRIKDTASGTQDFANFKPLSCRYSKYVDVPAKLTDNRIDAWVDLQIVRATKTFRVPGCDELSDDATNRCAEGEGWTEDTRWDRQRT